MSLNSSVSNSLGTLTNWTTTSAGVQGVTDNGNFKVGIYNDNVVRVTITKQKFEDFSYAVVAVPQPTEFTIAENDSQLEVKTKEIFLVITKRRLGSLFTLRWSHINGGLSLWNKLEWRAGYHLTKDTGRRTFCGPVRKDRSP